MFFSYLFRFVLFCLASSILVHLVYIPLCSEPILSVLFSFVSFNFVLIVFGPFRSVLFSSVHFCSFCILFELLTFESRKTLISGP